ncbi:uncharacterized protein TNCV_2382691 [Trichonephila clavipes]|nr:uncharacterized protein TNCV_2382691 [Trichonephila clavipes]
MPSDVGEIWNEAVDELAFIGFMISLTPCSSVLNHSETHFLHRAKMNLTWLSISAHHWHAAKSPGLYLQCRSSMAFHTALTCLGSGHLRGMTFMQGLKFLFTFSCPLPASPAHHLDSWAFPGTVV